MFECAGGTYLRERLARPAAWVLTPCDVPGTQAQPLVAALSHAAGDATPMVFGAGPSWVAPGWRRLAIGHEAIIDLGRRDLAAQARRATRRRGRFRVRLSPVEDLAAWAAQPRIAALRESWRRRHRLPPFAYVLDPHRLPSRPGRMVWTLEDTRKRPCAALAVATYRRHPAQAPMPEVEGWWHTPGAPTEAVTRLLFEAAAFLQTQGARSFGLSLSPLGRGAPSWLRAQRAWGRSCDIFDGVEAFNLRLSAGRKATRYLMYPAQLRGGGPTAVGLLLRAFAGEPLHHYARRAASRSLRRGR